VFNDNLLQRSEVEKFLFLKMTSKFVYLLIYSIFNDAFSGSGYGIQCRMRGKQVNDELKKMWKEAVVA
jgi:hypothetical protein